MKDTDTYDARHRVKNHDPVENPVKNGESIVSISLPNARVPKEFRDGDRR